MHESGTPQLYYTCKINCHYLAPFLLIRAAVCQRVLGADRAPPAASTCGCAEDWKVHGGCWSLLMAQAIPGPSVGLLACISHVSSP